MAKKKKKARSRRPRKEIFNHPKAGKCERDPSKVAILWAPESNVKGQDALLKAHGLVAIQMRESKSHGPHAHRVNQTKSLFLI